MQKSPLLVKIGQRIRALRLQQKISQEDLADKAGLDRTYIGGLERGEQNASLLSLEKICNALGMSIFDFFNKDKN